MTLKSKNEIKNKSKNEEHKIETAEIKEEVIEAPVKSTVWDKIVKKLSLRIEKSS